MPTFVNHGGGAPGGRQATTLQTQLGGMRGEEERRAPRGSRGQLPARDTTRARVAAVPSLDVFVIHLHERRAGKLRPPKDKASARAIGLPVVPFGAPHPLERGLFEVMGAVGAHDHVPRSRLDWHAPAMQARGVGFQVDKIRPPSDPHEREVPSGFGRHARAEVALV